MLCPAQNGQVKQTEAICYIMKKKANSANLIVRESIETALIQLMGKKPFGEITISEIVKKAGVSRVSYYRNYYYKEDVLFARMDKIAAEWKTNAETINKDVGEQIIELFEMERTILDVLYKNGLEHLMYKLIRKYCGLEEKIDDNIRAYFTSMIAGMFFGWCDEWVKRGMQEKPEQIKEILNQWGHNIQMPQNK